MPTMTGTIHLAEHLDISARGLAEDMRDADDAYLKARVRGLAVCTGTMLGNLRDLLRERMEEAIPEFQSPRIPDRSFDHWVNGTPSVLPTYVEPRPPPYRFEPAKDLEEWGMA